MCGISLFHWITWLHHGTADIVSITKLVVFCRRVGEGREADGIAGGNDEEHTVIVGPGEKRTAKVVQKTYYEIQAAGTN